MKKFLLAPALAALAMFVFGAIFWMSPFPYKALGRVTDDAAAGAALAKIFPVSGAYLVPGKYLDAAKREEFVKRGPIAEVHFVNSGLALMDPKQLVKGYLHEFAICIVLVFMLDGASTTFRGFGCRVKFCASIGLLISLYTYGYAIWWNHSLGWTSVQAIYDFLAFVVAGLVLGKILTPKSTVAAPPTP